MRFGSAGEAGLVADRLDEVSQGRHGEFRRGEARFVPVWYGRHGEAGQGVLWTG